MIAERRRSGLSYSTRYRIRHVHANVNVNIDVTILTASYKMLIKKTKNPPPRTKPKLNGSDSQWDVTIACIGSFHKKKKKKSLLSTLQLSMGALLTLRYGLNRFIPKTNKKNLTGSDPWEPVSASTWAHSRKEEAWPPCWTSRVLSPAKMPAPLDSPSPPSPTPPLPYNSNSAFRRNAGSVLNAPCCFAV